jgi:tRNA(fMet)-specific endonuclease VapC
MSRYLLDTNIVSDLIRNPQGQIAAKLRALPPDAVCTSVIVAGELRFGAAKRGSKELSERAEGVLARLPVLPLTAEVSVAYAAVRMALEAKGQPIGGNDLWIAAQALSEGMVLVTENVREFERVEGLRVDRWG